MLGESGGLPTSVLGRKHTYDFSDAVCNVLKVSPWLSCTEFAKMFNVSDMSVRMTLKRLSLSSYIQRRTQLLTALIKEEAVWPGPPAGSDECTWWTWNCLL